MMRLVTLIAATMMMLSLFSALRFHPQPLITTHARHLPHASSPHRSSSRLSVVNQADDYVYGAVAAPDWVLPLGAILVIATAAIPILLR